MRGVARRVSPLTYVQHDLPPIFIALGAKDLSVPVEQSIRLHIALDLVGIANEITAIPGAKPGFRHEQWDPLMRKHSPSSKRMGLRAGLKAPMMLPPTDHPPIIKPLHPHTTGNKLDAKFKGALRNLPGPAATFNFHRLRHTWATRLMNNGMDLAVLKELGGWESWSSMQCYTLYSQDDGWMFATPFTNGERPYWPDSALKDHVKPAAAKAGITKRVTWHTFRHSLASFLGQSGENVKTVQELLRHASSRLTQDVYQQGSTEAKRLALGRVAGIFTVPIENS